jgi:hypothetical protein
MRPGSGFFDQQRVDVSRPVIGVKARVGVENCCNLVKTRDSVTVAPPNRRVREEADFRRRLNLAREGQETEVAETLTETMVAEVMAELTELEDPKTREVNEQHVTITV